MKRKGGGREGGEHDGVRGKEGEIEEHEDGCGSRGGAVWVITGPPR